MPASANDHDLGGRKMRHRLFLSAVNERALRIEFATTPLHSIKFLFLLLLAT